MIDLVVLWSTIRKSWILLVLVVVIGVGTGALAGVLTHKTYTSGASLLLSANKATSTSELYTASLLVAQRAPVYVEALQGSEVAARVSETIGGTRTPSEVADEVGVALGAGGFTITVTVADAEADTAYAIATAYTDEATALIKNREQARKMDLPALTVDMVDKPAVPESPIRPDWSLLLVLGGLAGSVVAGSVAVLRAARGTTRREAPEPKA